MCGAYGELSSRIGMIVFLYSSDKLISLATLCEALELAEERNITSWADFMALQMTSL